jgi:uncharacterized membrane protein
MDWLALVLKLVHVVLAMALMAGVIGRWIVLHRAAESRDLEQTLSLLETCAPFERMTIASSMLILPAGLLTAWAQGYELLGLTTGWMLVAVVLYAVTFALVPTIFIPWGRRFAATLAGAREAGSITPELDAAFADPAVRFAHWAELVAFSLLVMLMVLKPF